tara:strand:- start:335 stop:1105 length:771 start_codon:yes stop_codon:yes gene_type:complete
MKELDDLIIVIGGNGRIGKGFCLNALKNTNYTIVNIDPSLDSLRTDNKKYIHIKIPIDGLDSAKRIIKVIKESFPDKKLNSIVNLSRESITKNETIIINEDDVMKNINVQIVGLNHLIDQLINCHNFNNFSIIHLGSLGSRLVSHQSVLYHYLKGAIESASKALAFKLAKHNVRSNVIRCGLVKDPLFKLSDKQIKVEKKVIPLLSGPPTVEDVGNLILFLISPNSRSITGASFLIDAGMSLPDSYTVLSNLNDFN